MTSRNEKRMRFFHKAIKNRIKCVTAEKTELYITELDLRSTIFDTTENRRAGLYFPTLCLRTINIYIYKKRTCRGNLKGSVIGMMRAQKR